MSSGKWRSSRLGLNVLKYTILSVILNTSCHVAVYFQAILSYKMNKKQ